LARLWYLRKENETLGPFPAGAVVADRLVGRIAANDELSPDHQEWRAFDAWPELVALAHEAASEVADTQWGAERAKARLRWLDQRSYTDRRSVRDSEAADRDEGRSERRVDQYDSALHRSTRRARTSMMAEPSVLTVLLAIVLCAALVALLVWLFGPVNPVPVRIH
jgi:hypothetical protein